MESVSVFHAALAERREQYNARFRLVKHRSKNLDANAFLTHLRDVVGPAVEAAAAAGGDPGEVTDALVDLAFATHGQVPYALRQLLPELAGFVAAEPKRVAVAMANALHHLGPSAGAWAHTMTVFAPRADSVESLLDIGAVAAWRHGLAVLRNSALTAARRVRPETLTDLLGTSDVDSLAADPWLTPGRAPGLQVVRRVGKFRGFGGAFAQPPRVFVSAGHWYASDGQGTWRVHADRFGAGLRRVDGVTPDRTEPTLTLSSAGEVRFGRQSLAVGDLAGATSWASMSTTLAATTPWTHAITFVAWS
ncbi:MAG: hypothetical protein ABW224_11345 [Kibdelosporangium sp.]